MADRNTGAWIRFENGAIILIGADPIFNLVPGSFRVREMPRERVGNRDRGVLGAMTVGDERPQEIEFKVYRTALWPALRALMLPAATNGVETFFTLTAKVPNYDGAAAGYQSVWNKCYLPDGLEENVGGSGQSGDEITVRAVHYGGIVTPSTY